ncbi:MAG: hypothetical protein RIR18_2084 [Pseudomonadota bacterium]|jgi:sec-independent protein translocase protein TatB
MFDVGFSELLVIGIVALIVIGPEKLPAVARTLGHLLGRAQRYVNDVKTDINREMQLDELKKLQSQMTDSVRTLEQSVREEMDEAQAALGGISSAVIEPVQPQPVLQPTLTQAVSADPKTTAQA